MATKMLTVTPAFQNDFWLSGLSRYSMMKNVLKTPAIVSQTRTPQQPSFFSVWPSIVKSAEFLLSLETKCWLRTTFLSTSLTNTSYAWLAAWTRGNGLQKSIIQYNVIRFDEIINIFQ